MLEISKGNVKKLKRHLKKAGSKSGYMNQDQLVALLCYALERKEHPKHNYAVAVTRAIVGTSESLPRYEWATDSPTNLEEFLS